MSRRGYRPCQPLRLSPESACLLDAKDCSRGAGLEKVVHFSDSSRSPTFRRLPFVSSPHGRVFPAHRPSKGEGGHSASLTARDQGLVPPPNEPGRIGLSPSPARGGLDRQTRRRHG